MLANMRRRKKSEKYFSRLYYLLVTAQFLDTVYALQLLRLTFISFPRVLHCIFPHPAVNRFFLVFLAEKLLLLRRVYI
jgi:hypothetical protein